MTFRQLRIGLLLIVLAAVSLSTWLSRVRSTDWDAPLWVGIYPINADDSTTSDAYIGALSGESFAPIRDFVQREAERYGVAQSETLRMELYDRVEQRPPALDPQANAVMRLLWSLRLRWWASGAAAQEGRAPPDVRIFVLYHDPEISQRVPHSLGLQKGLLGVVHAFAERDMSGENALVIAHELLHTLGATDKYDPHSGQPVFPDGYADPEQEPLHPQERAEVMAGRRALSETQWEMPQSLREVRVGPRTAAEINWGASP